MLPTRPRQGSGIASQTQHLLSFSLILQHLQDCVHVHGGMARKTTQRRWVQRLQVRNQSSGEGHIHPCRRRSMIRPRASRSSSHRDERWEGCRVLRGMLRQEFSWTRAALNPEAWSPDSSNRKRGRFRLRECINVGPPQTFFAAFFECGSGCLLVAVALGLGLVALGVRCPWPVV